MHNSIVQSTMVHNLTVHKFMMHNLGHQSCTEKSDILHRDVPASNQHQIYPALARKQSLPTSGLSHSPRPCQTNPAWSPKVIKKTSVMSTMPLRRTGTQIFMAIVVLQGTTYTYMATQP